MQKSKIKILTTCLRSQIPLLFGSINYW